MSYTYYPGAGIVVRTSDGVQVTPVADDQSPEHLEWLAWCALGNTPTLGIEEATSAAPRTISTLAFRRRFTFPERVACDAAPTNMDFDAQTRAALTTMQKDLDAVKDNEIDLDDADVIAGLAFLESLGLLAAGRADEIRA